MFNREDWILELKHDSGHFSESSNDDYSDNYITFISNVEFNHRNQLNLTYSYEDAHEERGAGIAQGPNVLTIDSPVEFDKLNWLSKYSYGSEGARGRIEFSLGGTDVEHSNFLNVTGARDYSKHFVSGLFSANVFGRTELNFNVSSANFDYEAESGGLDRKSNRVLFGVGWDFTGKTNGSVSFGRKEVDFDNRVGRKFVGPTWEVSVEMNPNTYSQIHVLSSQEEREPFGDAAFINVKNSKLSYTVYFLRRLALVAEVRLLDSEYVASLTDRYDREEMFGLSTIYNLRRWLDLSLKAKYKSNDSNVHAFRYEGSEIGLYLDASL